MNTKDFERLKKELEMERLLPSKEIGNSNELDFERNVAANNVKQLLESEDEGQKRLLRSFLNELKRRGHITSVQEELFMKTGEALFISQADERFIVELLEKEHMFFQDLPGGLDLKVLTFDKFFSLINNDMMKLVKSIAFKFEYITDKEVQKLAAALDKFPKLEVLDFSGNDIGDEGLLALASSPNAKKIRKLDVCGNTKITDRSANAIAWSGNFKDLEMLFIGGTSISEDAARMIVKTCNCEVFGKGLRKNLI